jgi:hypothetical protein
MAWETRRGRGHYYTRSVRQGGRVTTEYVGAGAPGELAAAQDVARRAARAAERAAWQAECARAGAEERALGALCADVEAAFRAVLEAAGYHQHRRGAWRRWRR